MKSIAPALWGDGFMTWQNVETNFGQEFVQNLIRRNIVGIRYPTELCLDLPKANVKCIVPFVPLDRVCLQRILKETKM